MSFLLLLFGFHGKSFQKTKIAVSLHTQERSANEASAERLEGLQGKLVGSASLGPHKSPAIQVRVVIPILRRRKLRSKEGDTAGM